ncbi:MAG: hypothetical protein WBP97_04195, partial [Candidatus Sulfotelmatobacter sp.]
MSSSVSVNAGFQQAQLSRGEQSLRPADPDRVQVPTFVIEVKAGRSGLDVTEFNLRVSPGDPATR